MVKRRHKASDEIMLIPFLDILCSLIGVLVLIIVVLCVAQTQKINGRTPEELARAEEYQRMLKQQKELEKINEQLKDKLVQLDKLKQDTQQKEEQAAKLRKLRDTSEADKKKNQEVSQNLLKELDNLLVEVNGLKTQQPPLQKEIAALQAEIAKRKPPANTGAPVIVQPGGSGLAKGTKVFFVEASGGKLTFYWDDQKKNVVAATPDVIATDVAFNAFLKAVLAVPQSKIIFLLRDDGMGAYNLGAGWAQGNYKYPVEKIGKLPLPGRGDVDLRMFKEFQGSITPPPEVTAAPAPGAPKATPAPAAPAGAKPAAAATPAPAAPKP